MTENRQKGYEPIFSTKEIRDTYGEVAETKISGPTRFRLDKNGKLDLEHMKNFDRERIEAGIDDFIEIVDIPEDEKEASKEVMKKAMELHISSGDLAAEIEQSIRWIDIYSENIKMQIKEVKDKLEILDGYWKKSKLKT